MIRLKRAYESPGDEDGFRVLVERLWPRGISRARARIDAWPKELAPSPALRTWYAHDPQKWAEFRRRYLAELKSNPAVPEFRALLRKHKTVTFVFAARDVEHSSAALLRDFLARTRRRKSPAGRE
jgi:uncharacterized protein YeaO (DUF488 family)